MLNGHCTSLTINARNLLLSVCLSFCLSVCLLIIPTMVQPIDFTLGRCIVDDQKEVQCWVWSCLDERFSRKSYKQQYRKPSNLPVPNRHVLNRNSTSYYNDRMPSEFQRWYDCMADWWIDGPMISGFACSKSEQNLHWVQADLWGNGESYHGLLAVLHHPHRNHGFHGGFFNSHETWVNGTNTSFE